MALEIRLAHFEKLAEELSDVLMEQNQRIDLLTLQVKRLKERLAEAAWSAAPSDDRPPPHY